jgi:hypothetical protein
MRVENDLKTTKYHIAACLAVIMVKLEDSSKDVDYEGHHGTVIRRLFHSEFHGDYEYARTLELMEWQEGYKEVRFRYYLRPKGGSDGVDCSPFIHEYATRDPT